MTSDATLAFQHLGPNEILDAIDSAGYQTDGRVAALNSYENRVYQIGLEDGDFIVAKFYRPERWSDQAIQEEHDFTQELADTDIPVIAPVRDSHAQSLFKHGDYRFATFVRAGGRAPELDNADQLEVIGRTLGRLHLVGEQQPFAHRISVSPERLGQASIDFLLASDLMPGAAQTVYDGVVNDMMTVINAAFQNASSLTQLRIHGDFHPGNILWGRDDTPHVLDFDDTCTGPAIQDLWMFISGDREYRTARLGDLLEGYTQFRDFDPAELALVEPLRGLRLIHYAAWIAKRWEDPAFKLAFPFFGEQRFWDEHILSLREQRAALDERPLVWD